jgi:hypothetical protein
MDPSARLEAARAAFQRLATAFALERGLHEPDELEGLLRDAGFEAVAVQREAKTLPLQAAGAVAAADPEQRAAIERDTCAHWHKHVVDGTLTLGLEITTAIGQR